MGVKNKLVQLGWTDTKGNSLPWQFWHEKRNRQAVAYWKGTSGEVIPIKNVLSGFYKPEKGGKLR